MEHEDAVSGRETEAMKRLRFKKGRLYHQTIEAIVNGGITLVVLDIVPFSVLTDDANPNLACTAGYSMHEKCQMTQEQSLTYVGSSKTVCKHGDVLNPEFPMFIDNHSGALVTVRSMVVRTPAKYLRLLKTVA